MSLNIIELPKKELISKIADFVQHGGYLFIDEIADSLRDGSWIEFWNGENKHEA